MMPEGGWPLDTVGNAEVPLSVTAARPDLDADPARAAIAVAVALVLGRARSDANQHALLAAID